MDASRARWGGVGGLVRRDSTWTQETGALIFEVLTGSQMLAEARDTKAGLEKRLTRARNAMESMTLPCTRDGGAPVTGGDGEPGGLAPGDGRGPDGAEGWLQERERDSKRKCLRCNLATANERRLGEGRGDPRRAPGGARGPHAVAYDLDY